MRSLLIASFAMTAAFAADFPAPADLPASAALPDPLVMRDGSPIRTKEQWQTQRAPELRALFQHYMYGAQPPVSEVSGRIVHEDKAALDRTATLREVEVSVGLEAPVRLLIVTPNAAEKSAPCFLGMNFNGNFRVLADPKIAPPRWTRKPEDMTDENRGKEVDRWAVAQTIARGYAFACFYSGDVVPDREEAAEAVLKRLRGGSEVRGSPDTATIMAWAWGFSRMVDYLRTVPEIDGARIAVVGHSRNGKTALLAAAMDERIALAIPSQAGCGGTAPSRMDPALAKPGANGRPPAETVAVINRSFPHWFDGNFKAFNDAVDRLPFDQHCLIALCAPRPVLVSAAAEDLWANPEGQFEMLRAAVPVYALFGDAPEVPETRPALDALLAERLGYFIRPGKHSMTTHDWSAWLDYADKWLR